LSRPIVSIVHRSKVPGTPGKYTREDILTVKEMIRETLDPLGGIGSIVHQGDKVLIKPNMVGAHKPEDGATTDPRVVAALVQLIREETKPRQIIVADNPYGTPDYSSAREVLRTTGIEEAAKKFGADVAYVDEGALVELDVPGAKALIKCKIPRVILDCDTYISVPKLKTHVMTTVTLGVKNQWGILDFQSRISCHKADLDQALVDILRIIKPDLTLIDGIIAMEGYGPDLGDLVRDMNVIIAGKDTVSVDAVATAVMGIPPMEVNTTRIAHAEGLGVGDLEAIDVRGKKIEEVKRQFKKPVGGWDIRGIFPNVTAYVGGACEGCIAWIRDGLEQANAEGILPKMDSVTIITGRKTNLPSALRKPVFVVGDCAEEHKNKGYYLPGCPQWNFSRNFLEICKKLIE
jgi:uncharacterized protein (DUF362 family)